MNKKLMKYLVDPNTKEPLSIRSGGGNEVRRWCDEAGLSVAYFHVEESGLTVRAVKK